MDHSLGSDVSGGKKLASQASTPSARSSKPLSGFSRSLGNGRPTPASSPVAEEDVWGFNDKPSVAERVDARLKQLEGAHMRAVEGARAPEGDAEILALDPLSQVHEKGVAAYGDGPVYSERSSMPGRMEHRTEPPSTDPIESHVRIDGTWAGGLSRR